MISGLWKKWSRLMKTGPRTAHRPIKTGLYQSGPVKGIFGPVLDRSRSQLSPIWVKKPDWTGLLNTSHLQWGAVSLCTCRMVSEVGMWPCHRNVGCTPWSYTWEMGQNNCPPGLFPACSTPHPNVWKAENPSWLWSQLFFGYIRGILCE